jgi:hypothetical protein
MTNARTLDANPVEWSKTHLKLLIEDQAYHVRLWIRKVCEKHDSSQPLSTLQSFEEAEVGKNWRAPRLIHMHPAGNTLYDPAKTWTSETDERSQELLQNRASRFVQFLGIHLNKLAGAARIAWSRPGRC